MKDFFDEEWQATLYYEGKIKEALQEAYQEAYQEAFQEAYQEAFQQSMLATLVSLMKKGKITEAEAAEVASEAAGMSIADFKEAVAALD